MRWRQWLSAAAVAVAAVLLAALPLLVVVGVRDPVLLALGLPLLAGAIAGSIVLAGIVSQRATRPVEELAEAAGRLGTGDPRPVGRRYGLAELDLTTKEFDLLWILLRDAGKVVTREQIMREVWDAKWWTSTKTLDMHISWLRRKLGDDAHHPRYITTVRGVGFRFERGD